MAETQRLTADCQCDSQHEVHRRNQKNENREGGLENLKGIYFDRMLPRPDFSPIEMSAMRRPRFCGILEKWGDGGRLESGSSALGPQDPSLGREIIAPPTAAHQLLPKRLS
ncbi:MAG: hypothetical protein M2R45_04898 [Verrucomicrobia subdivision 3 bacterium]|nr:hypothetical protein [Limisphaerales bacterium]MCS1417551.1 hypothetical protein [Limisphaerales bacterium]